MEDNLMNTNPSETAKIKTHHARIVVDGTADNPYYSIEWFDPTKKEYYLGYSSYYIGNVFNWLSKCFEIVETTMTNADRIRAMTDEELVKWAHNQIGCGLSYFPCGIVCDGECNTYSAEECDAKIMKWLQQPAEGDA